MVIPAFRGISRTFGRYSGVGVSSEFVQQVNTLLRQGIGTVQSRSALRSAGFRFRDSAFNAVRNEIQLIGIRGSRLDSLRLDARPSVNTLVQTNREFGRNFRYTARVDLIDPFTGEITGLPVEFGDDRLLTKVELIERSEAIAEQAAEKGGPGYIEGIEVGRVTLTSAMQRAPR